MYKHIYDIFKHWYRGGQIFIYSDPHFNDAEANTLRKTYIGDEAQVKSINSKIGKNDTLIILGDIGDIEFVKKIRGYKVLIMGNHDSGASNYIRVKDDTSDNHLFDEVYEGPVMLSEKIILSHEPIYGMDFALNIHGHVHGAYRPDNCHINMCAEHINYTPVCLKHIIESGKLKKIKSIHRSTIDEATQRKLKRK